MDRNIDKISKAYKEFKDEDGFSKVISQDVIKENDFNLNVTLYVFPEEEVEEISTNKEWAELKVLKDESIELENKIEEYLKEIS